MKAWKGAVTRRQFLKYAGTTLLGVLAGHCVNTGVGSAVPADPTLTPQAWLPLVTKGELPPTHTPTPTDTPTPTATNTPAPTPPPPVGSRVVHVRDADATSWNGSGWYGNAVNQPTVNTMVQRGLQELTGKSAWADIWDDLFSQVQPSGYQVGQGIAIKVNFNNSGRNGGCSGTGTSIDALPQPVNALIAGLLAAGVDQDDIWVYDATVQGRIIPDRFRAPILSSYPDVQFYGAGSCEGVHSVSHGGHSSLTVQFSDPQGNLSDRQLTDVLYNATYLINMPILKAHGIHPVTLGFKNHLGSINNIIRAGNDDLHRYINPSDGLYTQTYSPLVDIFQNTNIRDKTILTVGDGLYGAFGATAAPPTSWSSFGDAPNSFLFSNDPVTIDCVMIDLLAAEGWASNDAYHYLFIAQNAGLGICEGSLVNPGGDPWQTPYGSGYSEIEYVRRDL